MRFLLWFRFFRSRPPSLTSRLLAVGMARVNTEGR